MSPAKKSTGATRKTTARAAKAPAAKAPAKPAAKKAAAKKTVRKTAKTPAAAAPASAVRPEERHRRIAEAAYFIALKKGFGRSDPAHDWAEAEKEVDAQLAREARR